MVPLRRTGLNMFESKQCLLDPLNERVTHQVEPQVHSLQVDLVHVLRAAARHDEVQQKLPRFKPQTILC